MHQLITFLRLLASALSLALCLVSGTSAADIAESPQFLHAQRSALPDPVNRVVQRYKLDPSSVSLVVQALDASEPVLSWNADTPQNPASTIKTLTTLVALDVLTPGYYWKTYVYLDGDPE